MDVAKESAPGGAYFPFRHPELIGLTIKIYSYGLKSEIIRGV